MADNSLQGRLKTLQDKGQGNSVAAQNLIKQIAAQGSPVSLPTLSVNQQQLLNNQANRSQMASTGTVPAVAPISVNQQQLLDNQAKVAERNQAKATAAYNNSDEVVFNKTWEAYMQAQKDAYGIETARGLEKYGQQKADITTSYQNALQGYGNQSEDIQRQNARDVADYQKFTSREQTEFNNTLALRNKDFGSAMSNAANAYGQKGLLRSGVALKKSAESVGTFGEDTAHLKLQEQQKMTDAELAMNRVQEDYTTNYGRLGEQKQKTTDLFNTQIGRIGTDTTNFQADQAAKSEIGLNALQSQGDQLYNQSALVKYQLEQDTNLANAQNKLYGNTPQPVRFKLRSGGQYSY